MTESKVLNEVALNRREINHGTWGSFIISRPTNRVLSKIETAQTRSFNRDLQTTELVPDASQPSGFKSVPSFLTRTSKERLLEQHGEWTEEDKIELESMHSEYRGVCAELDDAGFVGIDYLLNTYKNLAEELREALGNKLSKYQEQFDKVIPLEAMETGKTIEETGVEIPEFIEAKTELENVLKDPTLAPLFDKLNELHKQYSLYIKGVLAQAKLFTVKLKEITLFADTIEARAEKEGQIVKIFECTLLPDETKPWKNLNACENEPPDKLAWVLQEIEKFERLDPSGEEDDKYKYRFNFLFPLDDTSTLSGDSQEDRTFNEDGESPEELPTTSTEDSDLKTEN